MTLRLSHYRIDEVIGVGSFATVHRAYDERLNDSVAVKLLAENHSLNPEIRERFITEGRSLRRVGGEHAVSVYDVGESETMQPYLVLSLADRGSFRDRVLGLRRRGWVASRDDLLAFATALAEAVAAVHDANLVHRDLSPGNLLLSSRTGVSAPVGVEDRHSELIRPDERLLIADLGMCKDLAVNSGLTVGGGTEGFRPPEQNGPGIVDARADIWAMSALLSWLGEGSPAAGPLRKVLKRGMATKPKNRQADVRLWLREVAEALAPPVEPAEPKQPTDEQPLSERPPRRGRTRWRRILAATVLLAVLAGGILLGRWGLGLPTTPPSEAAGASISISGPTEIRVSEPATFTAEVRGVGSWAWTLPNGRYLSDQREVSVTATSPGKGEIILRSRTPDGEELETRHSVRVVE